MDRLHQIALAMLPGVGSSGYRRWMRLYPTLDPFTLSEKEVRSLFSAQSDALRSILSGEALQKAENEVRTTQRHGVRILLSTDDDFPRRLLGNDTPDAPVLLFAMGDASLNAERSIAIVGTRKATPQGRELTAKLVHDLRELHPTIVSGLAYGIDTAAHAASVAEGVPTVAVLGHGLDRIYPPENRTLAKQIIDSGGALVTEFPFGTHINPRNFPARNRIIAALADATVVVEASQKGGALITAAIALGYHREVFALPGRLTDPYSEGTNALIATGKAIMLRGAMDLAYQLGWPLRGKQAPAPKQTSLFANLGPEASRLLALLQEADKMGLDELLHASGMALAHLSSTLFDLEMQGLVEALPGRCYRAKQA